MQPEVSHFLKPIQLKIYSFVQGSTGTRKIKMFYYDYPHVSDKYFLCRLMKNHLHFHCLQQSADKNVQPGIGGKGFIMGGWGKDSSKSGFLPPSPEAHHPSTPAKRLVIRPKDYFRCSKFNCQIPHWRLTICIWWLLILSEINQNLKKYWTVTEAYTCIALWEIKVAKP